MTINTITTSLISAALALLLVPAQTKAAPTMCEFVTIEYQAALDRGDIETAEFWELIKNCYKMENNVCISCK